MKRTTEDYANDDYDDYITNNFSSFGAHLMRLLANATNDGREKLRTIYPLEVAVYEKRSKGE